MRVLGRVVKAAWRAIWSSWLVWPAAAVTVALRDYLVHYSSDNPIVSCVLLVSWVLVLAAEACIVYVISRAGDGRIDIRGTWQGIRQTLLRLAAAAALIEILVVTSFVCGGVVRNLIQLQMHSGVVRVAGLVFVTPLITGVSSFALCAIVISGLPPLKAIWDALLIATNNWIRVACLALGFAGLRFTILAGIVVAAAGRNWSNALAMLPTMDPAVRASANRMSLLWVIVLPAAVIVAAFELAVYTRAYLEFTHEIRYPWIERQLSSRDDG